MTRQSAEILILVLRILHEVQFDVSDVLSHRQIDGRHFILVFYACICPTAVKGSHHVDRPVCHSQMHGGVADLRTKMD